MALTGCVGAISNIFICNNGVADIQDLAEVTAILVPPAPIMKTGSLQMDLFLVMSDDNIIVTASPAAAVTDMIGREYFSASESGDRREVRNVAHQCRVGVGTVPYVDVSDGANAVSDWIDTSKLRPGSGAVQFTVWHGLDSKGDPDILIDAPAPDPHSSPSVVPEYTWTRTVIGFLGKEPVIRGEKGAYIRASDYLVGLFPTGIKVKKRSSRRYIADEPPSESDGPISIRRGVGRPNRDNHRHWLGILRRS